MDYLRKLASGELKPSPMLALMGLKVIEVAPGRAVLAVEPHACKARDRGRAGRPEGLRYWPNANRTFPASPRHWP